MSEGDQSAGAKKMDAAILVVPRSQHWDCWAPQEDRLVKNSRCVTHFRNGKKKKIASIIKSRECLTTH